MDSDRKFFTRVIKDVGTLVPIIDTLKLGTPMYRLSSFGSHYKFDPRGRAKTLEAMHAGPGDIPCVSGKDQVLPKWCCVKLQDHSHSWPIQWIS